MNWRFNENKKKIIDRVKAANKGDAYNAFVVCKSDFPFLMSYIESQNKKIKAVNRELDGLRKEICKLKRAKQ